MSDKPLAGAGRPKMKWYPLFVDDFTLDTRLWPLDAVGALIRLMNEQWAEGSLPMNQAKLARIAGCWEADQWSEIWNDCLVRKFTEISPGRLVNNRLNRERIRIEKKGQQAKRAAMARWHKETGDAEGDAGSMRTHPKTHANQEPRTKNKERGKKPSASVPHQKIVDLYHEHCPTLPRVKVINSKRKAAMRARWKNFEVEVQGSMKRFDDLETWERYFKFISNNCSFLLGENDRNWVANFDFVIRESAMVGVFENKYTSRKS